MLALVAASIVASFDPTWLSAPLAQRAREAGVRPERVSRAKARVIGAIEDLVARATHRGRPPTPKDDHPEAHAGAAQALLAVATSVLAKLGVKGRAVQDELVAAHQRLRREHGIGQRGFCEALALPERTLRSWCSRAPAAPTPVPSPEPLAEKPPPPRRGRFALEVTPPGVQAMADTTDWELFGVPLKVLAVQDPGARGQRIWEASTVETSEDAQKVVALVREALGERPGTQYVCDQGTPYMADATARALEELELEHAPQKEADPLGKATLERSFRSVKDALAPLVRLTARIAQAVPSLRRADFAAAAGRLLLGTFLAVDLAARRSSLSTAAAPHPDAFAALAEETREKARAERRSSKLTLERIHDEYDMPGSRADFVRRFRRHHAQDLLDAEHRMGTNACRCHARSCDRYFAAILNKVSRASRAERSTARRSELARLAQAQERAKLDALHRHRLEHPEDGLVAGLERVAAQWDEPHGRFLFARIDPFRGELTRACAHLADTDPLGARDRAEVAWQRFSAQHPDLGDAARRAIRAALDRSLVETLPTTSPSTPQLATAILRPNNNRHPPPAPHLRI
jgi:hypothetical protein